jgi:hypothetical protein
MTLVDLIGTMPISYSDSIGLALVFDTTVAARIAEVQDSHACPWLRVSPVPLSDGRMMLCGDLLTEAGRGGLLEDFFKSLGGATIAAIEVIPMADAVDMLPVIHVQHGE